MVVTALCMAVWWCLLAPRAIRALLVVLSSLLRFSASVGAVLCSRFGFPCLRLTALLACGVCGASWLRSWYSLGCPSWLVLLVLSLFILHLLLQVWLQCLVTVFGPLLLLLCVELLWGLWCDFLSPWPLVAPSPSVVSHLGFFLWRLFSLGLEGCGPVLVPPFFWRGLSFPCPSCFCLAVPTVGLSKLLEFS